MRELLFDVRVGLLSLRKHARRTGVLGLAIAAVTALMVLLNALLAGMSASTLETTTALVAGHLDIIGVYKSNAGQANALLIDYQRVADVAARALPEIRSIRQRGRGIGKIVSASSSLDIGLAGVDIDREPGLRAQLRLVAGSLDALREPGTVVLFEGQAERLRVSVGDSVTLYALTLHGSSNTVDCRVAAIARDVGLFSRISAFVPAATLRRLNQLNADTTGALLIELDRAAVPRAAQLASQLTAALEREGYRVLEPDPRGTWYQLQAASGEDWTGQKVAVVTWRDELAASAWTLQAFNALRIATLLVLLAMLVTGIMNISWIAIRERTREIGALRAIGMQRAGVLRMFMVEALLLGALAAAVGVGVGVLATLSINAAEIHVPLSVQLFLMRDTVLLLVQPRELLGAIALITSVTCCAAVLPSLRAARLLPVQALAHQR